MDSLAADGMRKCLADEFSSIYVFNLRGNARTAGEQRRKEGGGIFAEGSKSTVAVFLLVKNPEHEGAAVIHYRDIGDHLTRDEKLRIVRETVSMEHLETLVITPNEAGDWTDQRSDHFGTFIALGDKDAPTEGVFQVYSGV